MADETVIFGLLVLYKIISLLVGLAFAYMGYRLFLADKIQSAGDLTAKGGRYAMSLRGGAPGVFFSLFGTVLICFSIFKGVEYRSVPDPAPAAVRILPDKPPFALEKGRK